MPELKLENLTCVVDSREQDPWQMSPMTVESGPLSTGDYSVKGLEGLIAIERKSLPDLLGCIGQERSRFERELQRLLAYPTRAVIVEASWDNLEQGDWQRQITPSQVIGSVCGWIAQGIPFVMAGDRFRAALYAKRILFVAARRRYRELQHLTSGSVTDV